MNESPLNHQDDRPPYPGLTGPAARVEVVTALRRMKNKATGPNESPVEAWKALGEVRVDLLWRLMCKLEEQKRMPEEWK